MKNVVGFVESESYMVTEPAPVRAPPVKPSLREQGVGTSHRLDGFDEDRNGAGALESAPRVTRSIAQEPSPIAVWRSRWSAAYAILTYAPRRY
jgi:hypothetical protein